MISVITEFYRVITFYGFESAKAEHLPQSNNRGILESIVITLSIFINNSVLYCPLYRNMLL